MIDCWVYFWGPMDTQSHKINAFLLLCSKTVNIWILDSMAILNFVCPCDTSILIDISLIPFFQMRWLIFLYYFCLIVFQILTAGGKTATGTSTASFVYDYVSGSPCTAIPNIPMTYIGSASEMVASINMPLVCGGMGRLLPVSTCYAFAGGLWATFLPMSSSR